MYGCVLWKDILLIYSHNEAKDCSITELGNVWLCSLERHFTHILPQRSQRLHNVSSFVFVWKTKCEQLGTYDEDGCLSCRTFLNVLYNKFSKKLKVMFTIATSTFYMSQTICFQNHIHNSTKKNVTISQAKAASFAFRTFFNFLFFITFATIIL